jgi:hypothetical protein
MLTPWSVNDCASRQAGKNLALRVYLENIANHIISIGYQYSKELRIIPHLTTST